MGRLMKGYSDNEWTSFMMRHEGSIDSGWRDARWRLVLVSGWGISINEKEVDLRFHRRVSCLHPPCGKCRGLARAGACCSVH